ncbi:MAG TPA: Rrf2 family transcriptional regulator [archaeon]|nr:Rrf2 family transcriptional regulator [archaeon]
MLQLSEAASLAFHTMVFLANEPDRQVSAGKIASELHVSEAHLSKVLQRLARYSLVQSSRGPKGGFTLGRSNSGISLLEIYESVQGPLKEKHCLKKEKICRGNKCIFGNLLHEMNKQFKEYLIKTKLGDLAGIIGELHENPKKDSQD